jgi:hypothetical protein
MQHTDPETSTFLHWDCQPRLILHCRMAVPSTFTENCNIFTLLRGRLVPVHGSRRRVMIELLTCWILMAFLAIAPETLLDFCGTGRFGSKAWAFSSAFFFNFLKNFFFSSRGAADHSRELLFQSPSLHPAHRSAQSAFRSAVSIHRSAESADRSAESAHRSPRGPIRSLLRSKRSLHLRVRSLPAG